MDRYYTLDFFIFPPPDGLPSSFQYPAHFDDMNSAKTVADYWLNTGVFNAVKCKYVEEETPRLARVLDIPFFMRSDGRGGFSGDV